MTPTGFPHSDIRGSGHASCSPRRFAGCCVLPRLSVPRHPPCALINLPVASCYMFSWRVCLDFVLLVFILVELTLAGSRARPRLLLTLPTMPGPGHDAENGSARAEFIVGLNPQCRLRCFLYGKIMHFKLSKNSWTQAGSNR